MSNYRSLFMAIAVIALLSVLLVSGAVRGTMGNLSNSGAEIYVNNHRVDISNNGNLSKTYVDKNGTTHINIQHHSSNSDNGISISTTTRVNTTTDSINK